MKKKSYNVWVEEFDLNQEEVLASLKKTVDDRMLRIVNKNNKNSYHIVKETHLVEDCDIDSQIGETLDSTEVVNDLSIRLDETSHDSLTNLANEFLLFKAEVQQQLTNLWEHFLENQKGTYFPKNAPNFGSGLLSHGSEHTIQNGMVNKNYDIDKKFGFCY